MLMTNLDAHSLYVPAVADWELFDPTRKRREFQELVNGTCGDLPEEPVSPAHQLPEIVPCLRTA